MIPSLLLGDQHIQVILYHLLCDLHSQVILYHFLGDLHIQVILYHLLGDQHIQMTLYYVRCFSKLYESVICQPQRESPLGTGSPFFGII